MPFTGKKEGGKTKGKVDAMGEKGDKSKSVEQRLWWEKWEVPGAIRFHTTKFNPPNKYPSDYEKIITVAAEFTRGRVWPVYIVPQTGPRYIWEMFQHYLGIQKGMDRVLGKQTAEQIFNAFINDPEKSIKIFMTSHARAKGFIWAKANLDCIPRVLDYFIKFLIQSNVLPQVEDQLHRSLEVISIAMIELPNTWNISKDFPDKFHLACNSCWGKKADGYICQVEPVDDSALDEPKAKRQKCDADAPQPQPEKETSAETTDSWSSGGDWGAGTEGWGQDFATIDGGWTQLDMDKPENLLSLLGPTTFPLTHSPGIVERSMRRIVSITRPPSSVANSPPLPEGIYQPDADAVEIELDRRFAKVVLTPMIDWDGGEVPVYMKPAILVTSRGAVVRVDVVAQDAISPTPVQGGSPQPPYNPQSDDITLLIDNIDSQIDYLHVGMAIGGTWVQLVREGGPVVAKGKKGESKKSGYWYLDELALVVPSFWTIPTLGLGDSERK